jgi:hypothetical protein
MAVVALRSASTGNSTRAPQKDENKGGNRETTTERKHGTKTLLNGGNHRLQGVESRLATRRYQYFTLEYHTSQNTQERMHIITNAKLISRPLSIVEAVLDLVTNDQIIPGVERDWQMRTMKSGFCQAGHELQQAFAERGECSYTELLQV